MKKLLLTVATLALAATAQADLGDSSKGVSEGSGNSSKAIWGMSGTTLEISTNGSVSVLESVESVSTALVEGSIFIIQNPSDASRMSAEGVSKTSRYVVTLSGNALKWTSGQTVEFSKDPSGSTSRAVKATWEVSVMGSQAVARLVSSSGEYLDEKYGDDARLVVGGSGQVFTTSGNSIVVSAKGTADAVSGAAGASITFIDETSVDSVVVSMQGASAVVKAAFVASGNAFNALTKEGRQYE